MKLNHFGETVRRASLLLSEGYYTDGRELWTEVLRYDSTYLLAQIGLGKAYESQKDFKTAMAYFKLANDREGYSNTFYQYRGEIVKRAFPYILVGLVLLAVCVAVSEVRRRKRRVVAFNEYSQRVHDLRYPFYASLHPFKGFAVLKERKAGNKWLAHIIVLLFCVSV